MDRDSVVEHVTWSPRVGVAIGVLPEGRGLLRGGFGKFVQRAPLNVEAFPAFERRTVARFNPDGSSMGPTLAYGTGSLPTCERRKPMSATSSGTSGSAVACW